MIKPKMFPYHNKDIAFTSNHDVLGYLMTNAVGPSLSEDAATEEELQAWLALYCKFMAVLQGGHKAAPYCGHIAYSALPAKEVFFSSGPPRAVAFGASISTAGLLKPAFKIPTQVIRFRQIEEYFGDLEKQVREHLPPNAIYGSGTGLSLKGEKSQGFGSCAETLAWITMSGLDKTCPTKQNLMSILLTMLYSLGHGRVMGGVTLKTHQIAMLQDYDELAVRDARLPLCVNCRFWLEHIIKGNLENFPE